MVVNYKKQDDRGRGSNPLKSSPPVLIVDVLLHVSADSTEEKIMPCPPNVKGVPRVVPILHTLITSISSVRVKAPKDLRTSDSMKCVLKTIGVIIDMKLLLYIYYKKRLVSAKFVCK